MYSLGTGEARAINDRLFHFSGFFRDLGVGQGDENIFGSVEGLILHCNVPGMVFSNG